MIPLEKQTPDPNIGPLALVRVRGNHRTSGTAVWWQCARRPWDGTLSRRHRPQLSHHLLRDCWDGCSVNYLLRASDLYASEHSVSRCSESILGAFEDILDKALTSDQRLQAALPLAHGRCGVRVPSVSQAAVRTVALCFQHRRPPDTFLPDYASQPDPTAC